MSFRIKYMRQALIDLEDIRAILSRYYKGTKKRFFRLLKDKTSNISEHPHMCPVYEYDPDYRRMVVGDYLVFYIVDEERKMVEIHRILHGSQNISKVAEDDKL